MAGKNARQLLNREANPYWRFASAKAKKPSARGDSRWANNALRAGGRKRSALCKLNTTSEALFHPSGVDAKTTPKAPIRDYDRAA
jgi:hypothetical protein